MLRPGRNKSTTQGLAMADKAAEGAGFPSTGAQRKKGVRFADSVIGSPQVGGGRMPAGAAGEDMDGDGDNFVFASEAYEPRKDHARYVPPQGRDGAVFAPDSTVAKPNIEDLLRRVSIVALKHICRGEGVDLNVSEGLLLRQARSVSHLRDSGNQERRKLSRDSAATALAAAAARSRGGGANLRPMPVTLSAAEALGQESPREAASEPVRPTAVELEYAEHQFVNPPREYTFLRLPTTGFMTSYLLKRGEPSYRIPTVETIYTFLRDLHVGAKLSPECAIVQLIYVERLMEAQDLRLLACNWRPVMLCGLLMASKVWQDLSSWNVEFASVYPQFSLSSINNLERQFLKGIKWDLYISGSMYAKYYFALRSLNERRNFREKYNYMVQVDAPHSKQLEERSKKMRNVLYSRSL